MISRANHTCLLVLFIVNICSCGDDFSFPDEMSCAANGKSGTCKSVLDCKNAVRIIKRSDITSAELQNVLWPINCGYEGVTPKVCCREEKSVHYRLASEESQRIDEENDNYGKRGEKNPLSLLPKTCGIQFFSRIIGGKETESGDFPWLVALEYEEVRANKPIIGCAGTLITQRYVLTAAHCVLTTSNVNLKKVRLGENNNLSIEIESNVTHESYKNPTYSHDIALLRLAEDVPFDLFVQPICLPSSSDTGEIYWAAGWGQTETQRHSDVKLKIEMLYFDFDRCTVNYWTYKRIKLGDGHMCAGGRAATDTCRGDSGGPLMREVETTGGDERWVIDGVLSFGTDTCGLLGWPAVYSKVHHYVPWILRQLRS